MRLILILLLGMMPTILVASPFTFATWNIEWLSTQPSAQFKASVRSEQDYQQLAHYFEQISPQVLAFQEVNDVQALEKIIHSERFNIILSERAINTNRQFDGINQFTGFAIDKRMTFTNQPDLDLLPSSTSKLRLATYVVVQSHSDKPIHMLSLHLKAGCSGAKKNSHSCTIINKQVKVLNTWLKERVTNEQPFIVAGDFNHNLSYQNDWLWRVLSHGVNDDITLVTKTTKAKCLVKSNRNRNQTHQFRHLIDHIIVSKDLTPSNTVQTVFSKQDVLKRQLSDHCPISTQIH